MYSAQYYRHDLAEALTSYAAREKLDITLGPYDVTAQQAYQYAKLSRRLGEETADASQRCMCTPDDLIWGCIGCAEIQQCWEEEEGFLRPLITNLPQWQQKFGQDSSEGWWD